MDFLALPVHLLRLPLVARASRTNARSPWLAPPRMRFLFVGSRVPYSLLSAPTSRSDRSPGLSPCGSCGSLRPAPERTPTSYPRPCWIHVGSPRGIIPEAPTDPDVHNSCIRLFGTRVRYVTGSHGCAAPGAGSAPGGRLMSSHDSRALRERRLNHFHHAERVW